MYEMIKLFYLNNEDRQFDTQGYQIWAYKTQKKVLSALTHNTFNQRKIKQAKEFYQEKILYASFNVLRDQMQVNSFKSHLNTRMMHFLKRKCISMFKVAFTQWRMRFENRQFKGQAVSEYSKYRRMKLKRIAFDYFVAIVQQRIQVKDILKKAQLYF